MSAGRSVCKGVAFVPEANLDCLESDPDSAKDERNTDGIGFADESFAVSEHSEQVGADQEQQAAERHQDCRRTAQQQ
jgi:hypothetical protein